MMHQAAIDQLDAHCHQQKEDFLAKTENDKSYAESQIQNLEQQISNINNNLPQILTDIEIKLRGISATKYHVLE